MHFLQESYEFVRKTQILQICYSVEHFLQESDNIFAKVAPELTTQGNPSVATDLPPQFHRWSLRWP